MSYPELWNTLSSREKQDIRWEFIKEVGILLLLLGFLHGFITYGAFFR